jgi:hypothetical protein
MTHQPFCYATLSDLQDDGFTLEVHRTIEPEEQITGTLFWIATQATHSSYSPSSTPDEKEEAKKEDTLKIASYDEETTTSSSKQRPKTFHDENGSDPRHFWD